MARGRARVVRYGARGRVILPEGAKRPEGNITRPRAPYLTTRDRPEGEYFTVPPEATVNNIFVTLLAGHRKRPFVLNIAFDYLSMQEVEILFCKS